MGHEYTWAFFWGIAGFMAGIAAAFLLIPLWQAGKASSIRRNTVILGATIVFAVIAVVLYLTHGQPQMMMTANIPLFPASASPHGHPELSGNMDAGSMEQATAQLAARLRDKGGSDADWALLRQSYEFLGDNDAASLAAQHRVKDASAAELPSTHTLDTTVDTTLAAKLHPYQQRVEDNASDAQAWIAIAELNRSARRYAAANEAFAHVIALKKMSADTWADYADSNASQLGTLNNQQSTDAIHAALKLKPDHVKALWLQASLMHETRRDKDALAAWEKLLTLVPKNSSDYQLIQNNINEARALANNTSQTAATPAAISGDVQLDAAIKSKVTPGMTLFVFAKPVDAPGPPAAVFRTTVSTWPVNFVLDDSMSMIPTRKLSQFNAVTVQARLSSTGQAIVQSGDIQSDAMTVDVHANRHVALKLATVVE